MWQSVKQGRDVSAMWLDGTRLNVRRMSDEGYASVPRRLQDSKTAQVVRAAYTRTHPAWKAGKISKMYDCTVSGCRRGGPSGVE